MNKNLTILIFIFLAALLIRMLLVFDVSSFSDDQSYFILRQTASVEDSLKPIMNDPLSYGGRLFLFNPGYYYILAFFDMFFPYFIVYKFLPNLFAVSLVIVVYFFSKELTKNNDVALFTSFLSAFIPIYFSKTLNSLTHYSYVIPLVFAALLFFLKIEKDKNYVYLYLLSLFILCFSHPAVLLLIITYFIYMIFLKTEKLPLEKSEFELTLFSIFFVLWSQFLIFKKALLMHGPLIIWQNIPDVLLSGYFSDFNVFTALSSIGFVPFLCGAYIIYKYIFKIKSKQVYLLISFSFLLLISIWLKLIVWTTGLMFLSVLFVLFFSIFCKQSLLYIEKTKASSYVGYFWFFLTLLIMFTSIVPCYYFSQQELSNVYSNEEFEGFLWLKDNTLNTSVVLSSLAEGNLITSIAQRKDVMDSNFILIENVNERFNDLNETYGSIYKTQAVSLLNKYGVDYIYFSNRTKNAFNIQELKFISDDCFDLVYNRSVLIYRSRCTLGDQ